MLGLRQSGADVLLPVVVQPRASRNAVAGLHGNALKLLLTAPPVEGAANDACLRFLADLLGVSRSRLSIIRGGEGTAETRPHRQHLARGFAYMPSRRVAGPCPLVRLQPFVMTECGKPSRPTQHGRTIITFPCSMPRYPVT